MNTVLTSLSDSFQWKTFWKLVKKRAITFFMVEDVWDYSCRVLIKGFPSSPPCPPAPPFIRRPWWRVCGCRWQTVTCRHSLVRTHTDFPLSHTGRVVGFRSSILQLWWAIWSQSDHTKKQLSQEAQLVFLAVSADQNKPIQREKVTVTQK